MDNIAHWVDVLCPLGGWRMEMYKLFRNLYVISSDLLQNVGWVRMAGSDADSG